MARYVRLSHLLSPEVRGYGGEPGFSSEPLSRIRDGRSSNSSRWILSNHIGTHVDCPLHFSDRGHSIDRYDPDFWIFKRPVLVSRPANPGELIGPEGWAQAIPEDADLVLLQTGFESRRADSVYWQTNPGLSPELGAWLRAHRPRVRALGVDFLSASRLSDRITGREAHLAFLDPARPGAPVLLIEDMALAALRNDPIQVIVSPLLVAGADAGPVTVIAETGDG